MTRVRNHKLNSTILDWLTVCLYEMLTGCFWEVVAAGLSCSMVGADHLKDVLSQLPDREINTANAIVTSTSRSVCKY